jgi:hypothetical protein
LTAASPAGVTWKRDGTGSEPISRPSASRNRLIDGSFSELARIVRPPGSAINPSPSKSLPVYGVPSALVSRVTPVIAGLSRRTE